MSTEVPPTKAGLLNLLWLASPALPVGGFSYSEGLEAATDTGWVSDEDSASRWLLDQLQLSLARCDLAVVAQAIPAWQTPDRARIHALNNWILQTRETQEFRLQTEQMGRSLVEWARSLGDLGQGLHEQLSSAELTSPTYPVVMACALAHSGASLHDGLSSFAFAWGENMVQASIKSVPLGQSAGQRMLARLAQAIPEAVATATRLTDDTRQACTPMLAILSARHETQYSRLFRS
ncbi:urease accessory protein UreF [Hydrogenophaga sp. PAMC20947]|uniref:urease accessory protein UreF n=1 Tax=Hydrogenophaga sp. PAMC20947 TaxID=2565558 RepID=UPI00109D8F4E|nr:urease accessory protein UreF [Hydrogenophaga sp. PAMC20947]QCB48434.1 urease accessory protein UreF [Hydrogenophaga sp. PAMC20947]